MKNFIVLDVECKNDFFEVGGRKNFHKLGVSVVGVYDYATQTNFCLEEEELPTLGGLFREREGVIGYNISSFDYTVLAPYFTDIDFSSLYTVDLMSHLQDALGFRVSLNSVAVPTLHESKSGNGRDAVPLYRAGKMDELKGYCLYDVELTRRIYEYGVENGVVYFEGRDGRTHIVEARWAVSIPAALQTLEHLRSCMREGRLAHISYASYSPKGERIITERDIEVLSVRGSAIEAFCHLRGDRRRFLLDRVLSCEVQEKASTQQTLFSL